MHGKICVVTGANTGIGKEIARGLVARGATVVLACRNLEKGQAAAKEVGGEVMGVDLADYARVRAFADELGARFPRVDVLVNNAGGMLADRRVNAAGHELTLAGNHLGPFLLTRRLMPRLLAAGRPRVVNVASAAHHRAPAGLDDLMAERGYEMWAVYGRSKLFNILFTRELHRRFAEQGLVATACHPGVVATEFAREMPWIARKLWNLFMLSPARGADTPLWLATAAEAEGLGGGYFAKRKPKRMSAQALDDRLAAELWARSEALVGD